MRLHGRASKPDGWGRAGDSMVYAHHRDQYRGGGLEQHCFVIGSIGVFYDGETLYLRIITMQGERRRKRNAG